jgi:hypothetical protein
MGKKEKKYHFIYKTTNLLSGRYYIGMHSTDNLDDGYLGSGNRLKLAIRKYGKNNFIRVIIEFCESREELRNKESEIITLEEVAKKECMNLAVGGKGGFTNSGGPKSFSNKMKIDNEFRKKHSLISSERMKKTHSEGKIKYNTFLGKKHSEETKKKMSQSKKGKQLGKNNSQYDTCWITNGNENKKIKKYDLEYFINEGWIRGRKM